MWLYLSAYCELPWSSQNTGGGGLYNSQENSGDGGIAPWALINVASNSPVSSRSLRVPFTVCLCIVHFQSTCRFPHCYPSNYNMHNSSFAMFFFCFFFPVHFTWLPIHQCSFQFICSILSNALDLQFTCSIPPYCKCSFLWVTSNSLALNPPPWLPAGCYCGCIGTGV